MGEKRAGQLQYLNSSTQFADLALQVLDPLGLAGRHAFAHAGIDLGALAQVITVSCAPSGEQAYRAVKCTETTASEWRWRARSAATGT